MTPGPRLLVYGAGLAQGLALVTFPAASAILTSPTGYGLSTSQYGLMFLPQVIMAVAAASLSPLMIRRWSLHAVFLAGLSANLISMALLVLSQSLTANHTLPYYVLLIATGFLGFAFGSTVPALTTYAEQLDLTRQDRSILSLNALLGTGTALAPLLVALFVGLGAWWLLPLLVALGLIGFLWAALRIRLVDGMTGAATTTHNMFAGLSKRFGWYAAALLLYGMCETLFGNWSTLYLNGQRGLSATTASLALATFWATVTIGRLVAGWLAAHVRSATIYLTLPIIVVAGFLAVSAADNSTAAIASFALAGFGCSAFLPLSLSFAGTAFPRSASTASGELIASYQVGYGVTAFGVPPLQSVTGASLGLVYAAGTAIAAGMFAVARLVTTHHKVEGPTHTGVATPQ